MTELQVIESASVHPAAPANAYLMSLGSKESRKGMTSRLNCAAHILGYTSWEQVPWSTLRAESANAIMAKVEGAPNTRNMTLAALRGVAKFAFMMHVLPADDYMRFSLLHRDRGHREPAGRIVSMGETSALMQACAKDRTPAGARDAALIAIARGCGVRRAELAGMQLDALTMGDQAATIRVIGKGNKERVVNIVNGSFEALRAWLRVRGDRPGPLFLAINRGGRILDHGLSCTSLDAVLIKRCNAAGVKDCDWHDNRRSFISDLLDAGQDIATIAGMAGHSNVSTTAKYDRRPAEARRKAAALISVPYFGV